MGAPSSEQLYWMIAPLVQAGLELEQITSLVFGLGFQSITGAGSVSPASVADFVGDQPAEVQAAWWQAIGRMISADAAEPGYT